MTSPSHTIQATAEFPSVGQGTPRRSRLSLFRSEPDLPGPLHRWRHQLSNRIEDDAKLGVVLLFERVELFRQIDIRLEYLPESNERMISMLTWTASELWRTLDSMATPCSVNA